MATIKGSMIQKVKRQRTDSEKLQILREWEECGFKSQLIADKYQLHRSTLRNWSANIKSNQGLFQAPRYDISDSQFNIQPCIDVAQMDLASIKDRLAVEAAKEMVRRMASGIVLHSIKDKDLISLIKLSCAEMASNRGASVMDALEHSIQIMRQARKE